MIRKKKLGSGLGKGNKEEWRKEGGYEGNEERSGRRKENDQMRQGP